MALSAWCDSTKSLARLGERAALARSGVEVEENSGRNETQ